MSLTLSPPKQKTITGTESRQIRRGQPFYDLLGQAIQLLQYQELIRNLVIRDLKVRYKNSVLGVLWSLMNPLLMMIVFTVVFTVMAPVGSSASENFPVFVLCGLLPWNFFAASVIGSTASIVSSAALVKKVYFPREVLPLATVLAEMVNFMIALIVLFGMIFLFGVPLTVWIVYLPFVILIQLLFTLGISFFLAAINVFYRDTKQIIDVLMLAWFFMTPIFYPIDILPRSYDLFGFSLDVWRLVPILNPMASLIATYRVILYSGAPPALDFLARTTVTALVIFVAGWWFFNRCSWSFAEEL